VPKQQSRSWVINYLGAGLIWGSSFFFIRLANPALPPVGLAFWRTLIGAITLFVVILIRRIDLRRDFKMLGYSMFLGGFNVAIPFALFAYAEHYVSSAFAGMMNAFTPVATVLALLFIFRGEKVSGRQIVGLAVGIVGVLTLMGIWNGFAATSIVGVVAVAIAALLYGIGGPFIRKYVEPLGHDIEVAAFGQMASAAVLLSPFYFAGPLTTGPIDGTVAISVLSLGMLGSGIAYLFFYPLLKQVGSAVASTVTLVVPLVAVTLGVLVLGETLSINEPIGGLVILLGAAIAQGLVRLPKRFSRTL
jgi:drug/metabolite transporter (DMT)-like permease